MYKILSSLMLSLVITTCFAGVTLRIPQIKNAKVAVWQTTIYPGKQQELKMHRHDQDRVLVALTDGILRVEDADGKQYLLKLHKNHSYFLPADKPGTQHTDENITGHPIKVIVINLE